MFIATPPVKISVLHAIAVGDVPKAVLPPLFGEVILMWYQAPARLRTGRTMAMALCDGQECSGPPGFGVWANAAGIRRSAASCENSSDAPRVGLPLVGPSPVKVPRVALLFTPALGPAFQPSPGVLQSPLGTVIVSPSPIIRSMGALARGSVGELARKPGVPEACASGPSRPR